MDIAIKAAQLVLALVILVTIHEFGHYFFARLFGVKVNRFYLFFNPWFSLLKYNPMAGTLEVLSYNKKDGSEHCLKRFRVGRDMARHRIRTRMAAARRLLRHSRNDRRNKIRRRHRCRRSA